MRASRSAPSSSAIARNSCRASAAKHRRRSAAIAQEVTTRAGARFPAVGIGQGDQNASHIRVLDRRAARLHDRTSDLTAKLLRGLAHALERRAIDVLIAVCLTLDDFEPATQIRVTLPAAAARDVAIAQNRREIAGSIHAAEGAPPNEHVRKTRVHAQRKQLTPVRGDSAFSISAPSRCSRSTAWA
jgi:hypothetical protein